MKVGYDNATSSNIQGTGTYVNNLLSNLKKVDDTLEFIEFDYLRFYEQMSIPQKITKFGLRKIFLSSGDTYWERHKIPKLGKEKKIDIYHSMGGCVPRSTDFKTIQTVLDLAYYYYPKYLQPSSIRFFKTWYKFSVKSADTIIAISQSTKNDIIKFWNVPHEKIHTIHLGVSKDFSQRISQENIESIKFRYNIPDKYFLFVGEINYRKNIHTLIKSFRLFKNDNKEVKLVLVGKPQESDYLKTIESLIEISNLNNEIFMLGRVSKDDLFGLYQGASAFIFPSLYEGFGLPILEAMASGTPVISSNNSSIPEVAGDAAILIDPLDDQALANAMTDIIKDQDLRKSLIRKGKDRAESFGWENTARKTLDLYKKLI